MAVDSQQLPLPQNILHSISTQKILDQLTMALKNGTLQF